MQNLLNELTKLLQKDERFTADGKLLKNKIIEATLKLDTSLLKLLLTNTHLKKHFFKKMGEIYVFDKIKFEKFVSNKSFLPDSYTAFKNKIGFTSDDEYIVENKEVVLAWPYKDCVLEGEQRKENEKRNEIFWNEILAPDEIDRLLTPKVLTNFCKYNKNGVNNITEMSREENLIIKGNNLLALHSLLPIYRGAIKLIYIDPPYNTGNDEFGYNNSFNHSTWLTFMKNRLEVAYDLLSSEGCLFIQINDIEQAYLKILCDEVFKDREFYHTTICVQMSHLSGVKMAHKEKKIPKIKEYILFYTKSKHVKLNPQYIPSSWDIALDRYKSFVDKKGFSEDECDKWEIIPLGKALEINGVTKKDKKSVLDFYFKNADLIFRTARNRGADYSKYPANRFTKIVSEDDSYYFIYKGEDVSFAADKIMNINGKLTPVVRLGDIWTDIGINNLSNEGGVDLRFGKKPEKLLERIIQLTTKEGDLVLDFFAGSGTTGAAAQKTRRKYILIEQLSGHIQKCIKRIDNVIKGEQSGVSKDNKWKGGGSFIYCELAKLNQVFVDQVTKTSTTKELKQIWENIKKDGFIRYKIKPSDIDKDISEFEQLSLENKKKFLIEILDKNHLYVNYTEIDDKDYNITKEDKKLNKQFYSLI